jgi:hypothetical protein
MFFKLNIHLEHPVKLGYNVQHVNGHSVITMLIFILK